MKPDDEDDDEDGEETTTINPWGPRISGIYLINEQPTPPRSKARRTFVVPESGGQMIALGWDRRTTQVRGRRVFPSSTTIIIIMVTPTYQ